MIGAPLSPHRSHSLAVLVRVVAAMVFISTSVLIPVSFIGAATHHLDGVTALIRIAVAILVTAVTLVAARQVDPLRR